MGSLMRSIFFDTKPLYAVVSRQKLRMAKYNFVNQWYK